MDVARSAADSTAQHLCLRRCLALNRPPNLVNGLPTARKGGMMQVPGHSCSAT